MSKQHKSAHTEHVGRSFVEGESTTMSTSPSSMTAGERVRAALVGASVDRVPFVFWHHFRPEGSGERLAQLTKAFFHDTFDLDIIKIMPDLPYPEPGRQITTAELRNVPR